MGRENFQAEQSDSDRAAIAEYFEEVRQVALQGFVTPTTGEATINLRGAKEELAPTYIRELPAPTDARRVPLTVLHLGASADGSAAAIRLCEGREASTSATRATLYRLAAILEENVAAGTAVLVDTRKGSLRLEPADISVAELIEAEDHLHRAAELLGLVGEGA